MNETLQLRFILSLTDRNPPGELEWDLLALTTYLQGLRLQKPATYASAQFTYQKNYI